MESNPRKGMYGLWKETGKKRKNQGTKEMRITTLIFILFIFDIIAVFIIVGIIASNMVDKMVGHKMGKKKRKTKKKLAVKEPTLEVGQMTSKEGQEKL